MEMQSPYTMVFFVQVIIRLVFIMTTLHRKLAKLLFFFFCLPDDFGTAYAFFITKLDFCNALLNVPPDSVIYRLQHSQTAAAKIHTKEKAHL